MFIKKALPRENFTKISNQLITDIKLSDSAFRLYCYLSCLPNGKNISDPYIMQVLGVSKPTLTRYKSELRKRGLILTERLAPKVYSLYLGHYGCPASKVRDIWKEEENE